VGREDASPRTTHRESPAQPSELRSDCLGRSAGELIWRIGVVILGSRVGPSVSVSRSITTYFAICQRLRRRTADGHGLPRPRRAVRGCPSWLSSTPSKPETLIFTARGVLAHPLSRSRIRSILHSSMSRLSGRPGRRHGRSWSSAFAASGIRATRPFRPESATRPTRAMSETRPSCRRVKSFEDRRPCRGGPSGHLNARPPGQHLAVDHSRCPPRASLHDLTVAVCGG